MVGVSSTVRHRRETRKSGKRPNSVSATLLKCHIELNEGVHEANVDHTTDRSIWKRQCDCEMHGEKVLEEQAERPRKRL